MITFTPDSRGVLYGAAIRVCATLSPSPVPRARARDSVPRVYLFHFTSEPQRVSYLSDGETGLQQGEKVVYDLYSAPLSGPGGTCTRLTPAPRTVLDITWMNIARNGKYVTYFADPMTPSSYAEASFHYVPVAGPVSVDVVLSLGNPNPAGWNRLSPWGDCLLYSTVIGSQPRELYSVPVPGPPI